jgi:hypothetical protein
MVARPRPQVTRFCTPRVDIAGHGRVGAAPTTAAGPAPATRPGRPNPGRTPAGIAGARGGRHLGLAISRPGTTAKRPADPSVDGLRWALRLWKQEDRAGLMEYLHGHELADHAGFRRLTQAPLEDLPRDRDEGRLIGA